MDHPDDGPYVSAFRELETRQAIANLITLGCAAAFASGAINGWPALFALAGMFGGILFGFWNWRCPKCSTHLGNNGVRDGCCHACAERLTHVLSWWQRHGKFGPVLVLVAGIIAAMVLRSL